MQPSGDAWHSTMPPFVHLLKANLHDVVCALSNALNAELGVPDCPPSPPLTNGILLDLFRTSKADQDRAVSLPQRLVELLHCLGYIPAVGLTAEKKWFRASSSMYEALVVKNLRKFGGVSKRVYLDTVREPSTELSGMLEVSAPSLVSESVVDAQPQVPGSAHMPLAL